MHLFHLLQERTEPIRIGLIGAGKFGTMFLAQVPTTPGIEVAAIADLDLDRARANCRVAGWSKDRLAGTFMAEDGMAVTARPGIDVIVEATGNPRAGLIHAGQAIAEGKHVIMVNVEADALAGPLLARRAQRAGLVYSLAYGDQPALTAELVDWARVCGFEVVAAGKGTKYLPNYHHSTPDTVWRHYGVSADEAEVAGMNARMFNSFLDGTKSAIEMAALANACGLTVADRGLSFPPVGADQLADRLKPKADGGLLDKPGVVEVISSLKRNERPVERDLRWGVYVVFRASNDYAADCFAQYGLITDATGRYAALYRPYHLIGLELTVSIASAVLLGQPTGAPRDFNVDAVAVAKRDLPAGSALDGEGGYTVWGRAMPAAASLAQNALPIGLTDGVELTRAVKQGDLITSRDVTIDAADQAVALRDAMIGAFAG
jgi:predicted homoserine dehydrogenase-like protein